MRKLIERLLIFFVGAPLIVASMYCLPQYNFLVYHFEMLAVGLIGTYEIYNIFSQKMDTFPRNVIYVLGVLIIAFSYLIGFGIISYKMLFSAFGIMIIVIFFSEFIFSFRGDFSKSIERLCTGIFMFIYPWGLLLYFSAITPLENAKIIILAFYLMIFTCDSFAWFFGMLFGKGSRGFIKASPKKSFAGFLGGFFGPIAIAFVITGIFKNEFGNYLIEWIIIGVLTALFAISGDIIESILKRSAGVKDTGNIILGRGGILDSTDSMLIAAPIFYFAYQLLIGGF